MSKPSDVEGKIFGNLKPICIDEDEMNRRKKIGKCFGKYWKCQCLLCGNYRTVTAGKLMSGSAKDCGCQRGKHMITHGLSDKREYIIWRDIIQHCYNKKDKSYKNYGAKGITICDDWLNSFENFYEWYMEKSKGKYGYLKLKEHTYQFNPENCYVEVYDMRSDDEINNITSLKIGKLKPINIISHGSLFGKHDFIWNCKCDCGKSCNVFEKDLFTYRKTSCGCNFEKYKNIKNFNSIKSSLYCILRGMKRRCYDTNSSHYKYYGGNNIKICDEWIYDNEKFIIWALDNGYRQGLSIERKDITKNYCADNCEWIELSKQASNKSNNVFIEYNNEVHYLSEWAKILGISYNPKEKLLKSGGKIVDNPNIKK